MPARARDEPSASAQQRRGGPTRWAAGPLFRPRRGARRRPGRAESAARASLALLGGTLIHPAPRVAARPHPRPPSRPPSRPTSSRPPSSRPPLSRPPASRPPSLTAALTYGRPHGRVVVVWSRRGHAAPKLARAGPLRRLVAAHTGSRLAQRTRRSIDLAALCHLRGQALGGERPCCARDRESGKAVYAGTARSCTRATVFFALRDALFVAHFVAHLSATVSLTGIKSAAKSS